MTKLILASASPRRKELLAQLGFQFDIVCPDIEEQRQSGELAEQYVARLSREKAQAGLALVEPNCVVLGSDTVVVCDGDVLEKPHDLNDATRMLSTLSNRRHQVMTAVTVATAEKFETVVVTTDVWFKMLNPKEIEQYWASGEPCDKAGSYGIQGLGGRFVTRIEGSYSAVVGLPLYETDQLLHKFITL